MMPPEVNAESAVAPLPSSVAPHPECVELRNAYWLVRVSIDGWLDPAFLLDLKRDATLADEAYAYQLAVRPAGEWGFTGGNDPMTRSGAPGGDVVRTNRVRFRDWSACDLPQGGKEVRFTGRFDFGLLGPTDIEIEHVFRLPDNEPWLEEQISLRHRFGRDRHEIDDIRFGFRKTVFNRDAQRWVDGADRQQLIPVPHRRRWGQVQDYRLCSYNLQDIIPGNWSGDNLPGRGAEAWAWLDGSQGYLIAKYNQEHMEFALADGEFVLAPSKRADDYYRTFDSKIAGGANVCFRFGGVGRHNTVPVMVRELGPDATLRFGPTRIYPVSGDWQEAYRVYKGFLLEKGHGCPADFDPPLHWNELYNLGWRGGDNAPLQELPELNAEAATAQDIGAEALYLDPVWDTFEGSSVWDEARLGPLNQFVRTMAERYGLKTSLHLMMHTKSLSEDPRIYRRRQDGSADLWSGLYTGGRICAASPAWQEMKTERLLKLAAAGVSFLMFDFVSYVPPDVAIRRMEKSTTRAGTRTTGTRSRCRSRLTPKGSSR